MNLLTIFKEKRSQTHHLLLRVDDSGAAHVLTCEENHPAGSRFESIKPGIKFNVDWTHFDDPDPLREEYKALVVALRIWNLAKAPA